MEVVSESLFCFCQHMPTSVTAVFSNSLCVFQYKCPNVHNHMDELLFDRNPHV